MFFVIFFIDQIYGTENIPLSRDNLQFLHKNLGEHIDKSYLLMKVNIV